MHLSHKGRQLAAGAMLVASGGLMAGTTATAATAADATASARHLVGHATPTHTRLDALNNSGVKGHATVTVRGRKVEVSVNGFHLLKNAPHAMHFHYSADSDHMCPTVRDDKDHDHRLTTSEGAPSYGMVQSSLTTRGDTSAKSALAVDRFPTAPHHRVHYDRTFRVSKTLARAIRHGDAALVIHGIDYNGNGKYDFAAGKSDLDPSLPAEATDPVACGVLHPAKRGPLG